MDLLRVYIRATLLKVKQFDEWLSPEVVRLLISTYAKKSPVLGMLKWKYSTKLGGNTWGLYDPRWRELHVNKSKTKHAFKQQVETILHEIQHWNQHADIAEDVSTKFTDDELLRRMEQLPGHGC